MPKLTMIVTVVAVVAREHALTKPALPIAHAYFGERMVGLDSSPVTLSADEEAVVAGTAASKSAAAEREDAAALWDAVY